MEQFALRRCIQTPLYRGWVGMSSRLWSSTSLSTLIDPKNLTRYGGRYRVTMIPGDGIGKELCSVVKAVFEYLKVPIDFEEVQLSGYGTEGPQHLQSAIASIKRNKICLKGIIYTPRSGPSSYNVALRKELDIYANVVPVKSVVSTGVSIFDNIDFYIIRENTEGEYSGLEHQPVPGVIESLKVATREKCERIVRFAFDWAIKHERKRVTCIHKANIMKLTDGLFLKTFKQISQTYQTSGLLFDEMIVDNASMQMVSKPSQFDVIVTPNLYGNICTNIGAALVGGPGLLPGCNFGRDVSIFEPGARHVGMDIKDRNCANPTAMLLSSCLMLNHLGLYEFSTLITKTVDKVISEDKIRTPDLGGSNTTSDFCQAILDTISKSQ
jgi:isocitrate dehydrogenase (NAD+)